MFRYCINVSYNRCVCCAKHSEQTCRIHEDFAVRRGDVVRHRGILHAERAAIANVQCPTIHGLVSIEDDIGKRQPGIASGSNSTAAIAGYVVGDAGVGHGERATGRDAAAIACLGVARDHHVVQHQRSFTVTNAATALAAGRCAVCDGEVADRNCGLGCHEG